MNSEDYGISKKDFIENQIIILYNAIINYLMQIQQLESQITDAHENIIDLERELSEEAS